MKIALAQLNPIVGNLAYNSQKILENAQKASFLGAKLLLTPELSLCGYPPRDLLLNPSFIQAISEYLIDLARKLPPQITVLVGVATINDHAYSEGEKSLYNSIAVLEEGRIKEYFHKRLLPNYDVFDEHRYFTAGKVSEVLVLDRCNYL
jgi:NAD+ synthase (glutamine-hydrolysing)